MVENRRVEVAKIEKVRVRAKEGNRFTRGNAKARLAIDTAMNEKTVAGVAVLATIGVTLVAGPVGLIMLPVGAYVTCAAHMMTREEKRVDALAKALETSSLADLLLAEQAYAPEGATARFDWAANVYYTDSDGDLFDPVLIAHKAHEGYKRDLRNRGTRKTLANAPAEIATLTTELAAADQVVTAANLSWAERNLKTLLPTKHWHPALVTQANLRDRLMRKEASLQCSRERAHEVA